MTLLKDGKGSQIPVRACIGREVHLHRLNDFRCSSKCIEVSLNGDHPEWNLVSKAFNQAKRYT